MNNGHTDELDELIIELSDKAEIVRDRGINPIGEAIERAAATINELRQQIQWNDPKFPPAREGKYLVDSTYGITIAHMSFTSNYLQYPQGVVFQDLITHNDEQMEDENGKVFYVYQWKELQ